MAQSGVLLRRNDLVAFGAKRTCGERRERPDVPLLTQSGNEAPLFVAMHATAQNCYT
jgi:hypothetical protein